MAFIRDLSEEMRNHAPSASIAIVANRVRRNTRAFNDLIQFLTGHGMPPVACLRDSQNYVLAAAEGIGIHEMKSNLTRVDRDQWQTLIDYLESDHLHSDTDSYNPVKRQIPA
jgi:chromosome partitioning protein